MANSFKLSYAAYLPYLLVAVGLILIVVWARTRGSVEGFADDVPAPSDTNPWKFNMYYVDWCPHCVKAKPDWQAFVQKYDQQVIQGYTVTCVGGSTGINCTNTDDPEVKEAVKRYNIQHYPTLIFVQNGTQVEFDAKINATNLDDFMNKLA